MEEKEKQQWPGPTTPPADDETTSGEGTESTEKTDSQEWPGPTTPEPGQDE